MPRIKPGTVIAFEAAKTGHATRAVYEHPFPIRFCHWLNSVSLLILVASGLRIFKAFPSFSPKVSQRDLLHVPPSLTLGGSLGGALQWHFTFLWIYVATGIVYLGYHVLSGHYRQVLFAVFFHFVFLHLVFLLTLLVLALVSGLAEPSRRNG